MLIENYYKINDIVKEKGKAIFQVSLMQDCKVYEGHFPDEPVSPGVCNIQMIKECAEQVVGKSLFLNNLQQCRLTTLITPFVYPQLKVEISMEEKEDIYKLKATIGKDGDIYIELKAEMTEDTYKN